MRKILVILFFSTLIYLNTLNGEFVYDDIAIIVGNPVIGEMNLKKILTSPYWFEILDKQEYRPLTMASYGVNYYVGKLNPIGYHLLNVALHALNSVLVFLVFKGLLKNRTAFIAALLFAAHPIHTEAVANVVGRAELLASFFSLISFRAYISKNPRLYPLALTSFFLALLSKENAVAIPLLILVYHLKFGVKLDRKYLGFLGIALMWLITRWAVIGPSALSVPKVDFADNPLAYTPFFPRLLTVAKVLGLYIKNLVLPLSLSADYSFNQISVTKSLLESDVIFSLALLIIAVIAFWLGSSEVRFGIAFFIAAILPASNIVPIGTIAAERLVYLPSIGFVVAIAGFIERLKIADVFKIAAVVFLLSSYSAITIERNETWQNGNIFWLTAVETAPNSARTHGGLGAEYLRHGLYDKAIQEFNVSLQIYPLDKFSRTNLGRAYFALMEYEKARNELEEALRIDPNIRLAREMLARTYILLGSPSKALVEAKKVVKDYPNSYDGHYVLGISYADLGFFEDAERELKEALGLQPDFINANDALGELYYANGEYEKAITEYSKVLKVKPDNGGVKDALARAHNELGVEYANSGRYKEAADEFRKAIELSPEFEDATYNLELVFNQSVS